MATINKSRQFQEILQQSPTLTGTISTINANGTSTVAMTGGGTLIAMGVDVPVGEVAYIKDQIIIGKSQTLPGFNLDV